MLRCCPLADLEGACPAHAPPRVQILSSWHTKFSKRNHLRSPCPRLRAPRPPTGNPGSATVVIIAFHNFDWYLMILKNDLCHLNMYLWFQCILTGERKIWNQLRGLFVIHFNDKFPKGHPFQHYPWSWLLNFSDLIFYSHYLNFCFVLVLRKFELVRILQKQVYYSSKLEMANICTIQAWLKC